ncbi:hypothetical protein [Marinomonas sp. ef1]|uniref:hypothetical protein n=1 Tax=Marinomonas sp. ef1 TaxID=2005043 RepID=UPI000C284E5B|nr:hypothetical protein [Marinomonas sp. ef1]
MKRSFEFLPQQRFFIAAFCAFLFSSVCLADTSFSKIVGSAYSVETGALLYRETHEKLADGTYSVEYSEPDGRVFGHKTLNFSQSMITPSFSQLNERNGEKIEVTQSGGKLDVVYQENSAGKEEKASVKLAAGMVVDAGFDAFIKQYWDALEAGKNMDIEYLVPSKQTTFTFRFSKTTCVEGAQDGAQCFALSPVSWLVKLAVDPIVVAYDPADKSLLRFTGRANICDAQGKYQAVDIQYHYM